MPLTRFPRQLAVLAAACWLVPGCGSPLASVSGQVVADGQPLALADGESVQLDFSTADGAFPPLALVAYVRRDGSFVADMNDGTGRGLTPGKYKVRVNSESTVLKRKVDRKLFKESVTIDAGADAPVRLTVDVAAATISQ